MLVMKFGGSSVTKKPDAICSLVIKHLNQTPVVVVSALSGVTDLLVELTKTKEINQQQRLIQIIQEKHDLWINQNFSDPKDIQFRMQAWVHANELLANLSNLLKKFTKFPSFNSFSDAIVAHGELISSGLISFMLRANGIYAAQVSSTQCIITNDNFSNADFIPGLTTARTKLSLLPLIQKRITPVVTGFIASNKIGQTTTLGRGGSDYSAAILAYALDAKELQIWTDVDGVFSADPRVVETAKLIPELSFEEAFELASLGAKVLHPRTILPALNASIPVRVLNTFNLDNKGSLIVNKTKDNSLKAISWTRNLTYLGVSPNNNTYTSELITAVIKHFNSCKLYALNYTPLSLNVVLSGNPGEFEELVSSLKAKDFFVNQECVASLSLVGNQITANLNYLSKASRVLQENNINLYSIDYQLNNNHLLLLLKEAELDKAIKLVHSVLIEGK